MYDEIEVANFVIVVCTSTYQQRALGRGKPGAGLGVRWEAGIITQEVYDNDRRRFIPVILRPEDRPHIPYFLRATTHYLVDIETRRGLEPLLRHIFGEPEVAPTPIGVRPSFPLQETMEPTPDRGGKVGRDAPDKEELATPVQPWARCVDSAWFASTGAREGRDLESCLLSVRESLRAFSSAMSQQVASPCRATIYGLHFEAPGGIPASAEPSYGLYVTPVATSGAPELRVTSATPLRDLTDFNSVFSNGSSVLVIPDMTQGTLVATTLARAMSNYSNPHFATAVFAYRSAIVWPILRRNTTTNFLGFLTCDSSKAKAFKVERDAALGEIYAGLMYRVLTDLRQATT